MEDNLLHAISKLRLMQFHVVTKVFCIFKVAQCTQNKQRSENTSNGRLQEVKNKRKSLSLQAQRVVAVAYRRWSFTRGSNCKALTGKLWCFGQAVTDRRESFTREVVAHGGSTVLLSFFKFFFAVIVRIFQFIDK